MSGQDRSGEGGKEQRRIGMIAVAWFVRMRSPERTVELERRFYAWLAADERHAQAYFGIEQVWDGMGELETLPGFVALRQKVSRSRPGIVSLLLKPLRESGRRFAALPRPYGRPAWNLAAAAAVLLVLTAGGLGAAAWFGTGEQARTFQTTAGERLHKSLSDGSAMTLSARTELSVSFSAELRRIVMAKGEAYFDVARDPGRPFRVEVAGGSVTAIGTGFDIRRTLDRVRVTVTEGVVEVVSRKGFGRPARVPAGHEVTFDRNGLGEVREVDAVQAVTWRDGRIHADNAPLIDVIDELNRHSKRLLKVDHSDPQLRRIPVTGQFKIDRPEVLVQHLRANGIKVWVAKDAQGNLSVRLQGEVKDG